MYEKFTDRCRRVFQLANQTAVKYNHEYVGTEHLMLALCWSDGSAVRILNNLDKTFLPKITVAIAELITPGSEAIIMGRLPHTPRAKKIIEYTVEEARNFGHNYVGTEHLLLGLMREPDGIAAMAMVRAGVPPLDRLREEVAKHVGPKKDPGIGDWARDQLPIESGYYWLRRETVRLVYFDENTKLTHLIEFPWGFGKGEIIATGSFQKCEPIDKQNWTATVEVKL